MEFLRFLDGGLDSETTDRELLYAARMVNGTMAGAMLVGAPFIVVNLALGRSRVAVGLAVMLVLCTANAWLLRRTHRARLCGALAMGVVFVHLASLAVEMRNPIHFYWFCLLPPMGALGGGLRASWIGTGLVILTWGYLFATADSAAPPVEMAAGELFAIQTLSILLMGAFTTIFVRAQRSADEQIRRLAFFDVLTGLPNRQLFEQRFGRALETARRKSTTLALLFIDLDGFKEINDSLGHAAGDALLQEVGRRFLSSVRGGDLVTRQDPLDAGVPVSRLAGDEFTLLLREIDQPQDAGIVARRLLDRLAQPIQVGAHEVFASASVGISIYPMDGEAPETLLAHADAAMYHAKAKGRNKFQFYRESMNSAGGERLRLETGLRRAIENGELSVHYQPFRDSQSAEITGAEALLRWRDENGDFISPVDFIPVAEETGLILPIGSWVLAEVGRQIRTWRAAGLRPPRISVNISGHQIWTGRLVDEVEAVLDANDLSPDMIELEITESTILRDDEVTRETLAQLDGLGVPLALDDFGTGCSSLSCLRRFPIGRVKIDRSFVRDIPGDLADCGLASAIVAMADRLQIPVVAEGIETEAQADFLRAEGCQELQGFLLGHPTPADEFERLLQNEKND